jgi:hypothetical protein
MGLVQMPDYRMYWSPDTRYEPIANVFTRTRFDDIKSFFHIASNSELTGFDPCYDRLFKVRLLYDHVLANCQKLPVDEKLSIDEQTIPYKGKESKMKQYNKAKPKKWGFKVYALCAADTGLIHNFYLYTGRFMTIL